MSDEVINENIRRRRRRLTNNNNNEGFSFFGSIFNTTNIIVFFLAFFLINFLFKPKTIKETKYENNNLIKSIWKRGIEMDLFIYLSENEIYKKNNKNQNLIFSKKNLYYLEPLNDEILYNMNYTVSDHVKNNGSIWAHVIFSAHHNNHNNNNNNNNINKYNNLNDVWTIIETFQMNVYKKKKKEKDLHNLLGYQDDNEIKNMKEVENNDIIINDNNNEKDNEEIIEIANYWHPTLHLKMVEIENSFQSETAIPIQIRSKMKFNRKLNGYLPVIHHDKFWTLSTHLIEINDTVSELPLEIQYSSMSMWKWLIQEQLEESWRQQQESGLQEEHESDMIREIMVDNNPYLLGLTVFVTFLHMIFDFLAFKNEISYWKNVKTMEGLSLRSIFVRNFFQVIIFLYLLDNETSQLILFSSGIGILIGIWKFTKICKVKFSNTKKKYFGIIPALDFNISDTYSKHQTKKYDQIATTHLLYIVVPLVIGYSIYSLIYGKHKGWYSWVISSLTGFVYAFGFVMMTPQLFINYKLKSVAALPWRMMGYKFLNTIIDDLFAFIIKMPLMHRLSCFRDDIIFLIYIYQRWIYPVDKSRPVLGLADDDDNVNDESKDIDKNNIKVIENKKVEIDNIKLKDIKKDKPILIKRSKKERF